MTYTCKGAAELIEEAVVRVEHHGDTVIPRSAPAEARTATLSAPRFWPALLINTVLFGFLWLAYSAVRTLTADSWSAARSNAHRVIDFQDSLGLPSEAVFQQLFLDYEWFVRAANVYYLGFHFPSMVIFIAWIMLTKRDALPRIRWALIGTTFVGLGLHLAFPLAPPRMLRLDGFVDTARLFGPDPYALGIAKAANEFAAMPSLHVGWALLIALAVIKFSRSRYRWLILAHPIITTFVVVVTANHYWADVAVGAALAWGVWWVAGIARPRPGASRCFELVGIEDDVAAERDAMSDNVQPGDQRELAGTAH